MKLIPAIVALALAGPAQAALVFDCDEATAYGPCHDIVVQAADGPTRRVVLPSGLAHDITLADEIWASGGRYELAGDVSGRDLSLYLYSDYLGYTTRVWVVYEGNYISTEPNWLNFGQWSTTVPEPSTLALVALAIVGTLGSGWRRR